MSAEQRTALEAILRQASFPADSDVSEQRRLLRELTAGQPLPADLTVTAATLGGVPVAEIIIAGIEPRHVVLYFHGGVYVLGDAFQAAELASQVGRRTGAKVFSVDYRLAPEHPFPAAVDDALAAYEALLEGGTAPSAIVIAGESAGGGLAIATLVNARDQGLPLPAAAFVMSPYADLTLAGATLETKREADPLLQSPRLHEGARRRSRPYQPYIRRPDRAAAPGYPGGNTRGTPRRRDPPRTAGRHRRRRRHPGHHRRGTARLPDLSPGD
jgi:epsilon-lactone hydrolase